MNKINNTKVGKYLKELQRDSSNVAYVSDISYGTITLVDPEGYWEQKREEEEEQLIQEILKRIREGE